MTAPSSPTSINWSTWQPTQRAVLLFVIKNENILLIHKKKGLGQGKINGPGGHIEPGETPATAAIRELQEEVLITPHAPREAGTLSFQFLDGLGLHVHVFTANAYTGTPTETSEAAPLWVNVDNIPYHHMWPDDRLWLPLMLQNRPFHGYFLFDNDTMLHSLIKQPESPL